MTIAHGAVGKGAQKPLVLHLSSLGDGGAEGALFRLVSQDRAFRHHVVSLTGLERYGQPLRDLGIPVTTLDLPRGRLRVRPLLRLWRLIRAERPFVVQTWMYHSDLIGGVVARLAGVSNVVWNLRHSSLDPERNARSTLLVARICARLSRLIPRRIICCAEKAREVHAALGYDAVRMAVIPNGYDLSVLQPDPAAGAALRQSLGIAPEQPLIGFVARFDPLKDHANLLQAMARLKAGGRAPLCLLIGTGMTDANQALAAQISALDLAAHVRLLGRRNDIPAVMNALDLHVMSSISEAFPNVLAEAMACGTPCVSTDVGDAAAIIGETGRIVPPRDPAALADAIAGMLALRETSEWSALRAAARQHVMENFSLDRMVDSYRRVWSDSDTQRGL